MVAEKLHAMVEHGVRNSRVKDLWDLAHLARRFPFDGEVLRTAITETFRRRGTSFGGREADRTAPVLLRRCDARATLAGTATRDGG